jgi:hypothetical protein
MEWRLKCTVVRTVLDKPIDRDKVVGLLLGWGAPLPSQTCLCAVQQDDVYLFERAYVAYPIVAVRCAPNGPTVGARMREILKIWSDVDAVLWLAAVTLVIEGFLRVHKKQRNIKRVVTIVEQLPIDLQAVIALAIAGMGSVVIPNWRVRHGICWWLYKVR